MYFIHKIRRDYSAYVQKMILNEPVFPNFSPPDGRGAQRAKITEKVHKPPLEVNVINFELNGFNLSYQKDYNASYDQWKETRCLFAPILAFQ